MISARLANYLAARNIHYGWVVAGITFLTVLAKPGAMGSAGVLIAPLSREFGWTTEEISSAWQSAWRSSDCSDRSPQP